MRQEVILRSECQRLAESRRFFNLNPQCVLVKGALRGALYNLDSGDVFSLDPYALQVLEGCRQGRSIEDVIAAVAPGSASEIRQFLRQAFEGGLGSFGSCPDARSGGKLRRLCEKLDFVWLELRADCNLRCRHCYCGSEPTRSGPTPLSFDEWSRLLADAAELQCRSIQFIGGEPLLYGDRLFDLARRAVDLGYKDIGVFSNLTFLKESWIDRIVKYKMNVSCSIYAKRPEIHDLVTRNRGSFERTMRNVHRLRARGVNPRLCVTVMKHNQDCIEETMDFLREMGSSDPGFDVVRPSGRGKDLDLVPERIAEKYPDKRREGLVMQTDREAFCRRCSGNSCWQGKIAVSSTGDVFPCIMQRDDPVGNVRRNPLRTIIQDGIRRYWDLSADQIDVCKDCEFRYSCHDCRPVTYGQSGNLTAKPVQCDYDPYQGVWQTPFRSHESLSGEKAQPEAPVEFCGAPQTKTL